MIRLRIRNGKSSRLGSDTFGPPRTGKKRKRQRDGENDPAIGREASGDDGGERTAKDKVDPSVPLPPNIFVYPARSLGKQLCSRCQEMLHGAFHGARPASGTRERPPDTTPHDIKARRERVVLGDLQASSASCAMCSLVWRVLKRDNGLVLHQAGRYSDADFNPLSIYNGDGGTDVDELLGRSVRVWFSIGLSLSYRSSRSSSADLLLSIDVNYKTRGGRNPGSVHPTFTPLRNTVEEVLLVFVNDGEVPNAPPSRHVEKKAGLESNEGAMKFKIGNDPRLGLAQKFSLMKKWISKNKEPQSASSQFTPTRLLHISGDGKALKLVRASKITAQQTGAEGTVRYAALSHRWGASQPFASTDSTVEQRYIGISLHDLPQTMQDAIEVVSVLGLSFLWIDSLCILQDDVEDWKRESETMGDVFGSAQFVIAAHAASDDSAGFLAKAMAKRPSVGFRSSGDTTFNICQRPNLEVDVTNSKLSKRGWVLQERFLATSTIHFTEGQIYYETTAGVQSEDGELDGSMSDIASASPIDYVPPRRNRARFFGPSAAPHLRKVFNHLDENDSPSTDFPPAETGHLGSSLEWLELVEMYSNCDLTRESDKLIAIGGMARMISRRLGVTYCAGIWADRISEGLLWIGETIFLSRPNQPRAPSWSWAALDGPIQFPGDINGEDFEPLCELLAIRDDSQAAGSAATGPTNWLNGPGFIVLQTKVLSLVSKLKHVSPTIIELGPGPPRTSPFSQVKELREIKLKSFVRVRALFSSSNSSSRPFGWVAFDDEDNRVYDFDSSGGASEFPHLPGFCFAMLGFRSDSYGRVIGGVLGIFLVRVAPDRQEYRRVGMGQVIADLRPEMNTRQITIM